LAVQSARARTSTVPRGVVARLTTETKQAFKTMEFWAMVAIVAGILIASWIVDDGGGGDGDAFPAVRAWLYVAIVGSAYIVSRGLAKAGSSEPYWADRDDLPGEATARKRSLRWSDLRTYAASAARFSADRSGNAGLNPVSGDY
jgi:hypothetical protein